VKEQAVKPGQILIATLTGIAALVASRPLAAEKFNVLLIAVDDMNNDLGCYGHRLVKSPQIDKLAQLGMKFERAYCQYPVCNPSRVSMLSGLRPDSTRIMDLQTPPRTHLRDVVFLPQYFRKQGYHTAHVGKVFHTGPAFEDPPSWDVEICETGKHPPEAAIVRSKKYDRPVKYNMEWDALSSSDAETADGLVARQSYEMLKRLASDTKPFFLAVGFRRPHQPYAAPEAYFDMYPPESIPALSEPPDHLRRIPTAAFTYPPGTPNLPDHERRQVVAAYYACISFVDAQVGLLMQAMDEADLWRNTVVVFYSDHGYHLGEHGGMWHKMSLFEVSARVPLIVVAPGVGGNSHACGQPVELIDVYPTLVDLCGLPPVEGLAGSSLRPLLENPAASWKQAAYTQVLRGDVVGRSVRTARWRYTEWDDGRQGAELYDYDSDPLEYKNLAGNSKWAHIQAEMRKLLHDDGAQESESQGAIEPCANAGN
jgi:iduronate 2-sulfatase